MKEKSPYESFFDNTQDIQCITCLDAYVLEYYICDCRVRAERLTFWQIQAFCHCI